MSEKNNQNEELEMENELNKPEETENTETSEENLDFKKQIELLEEDIIRMSDLLKRKAAEFENYKRRTENDLSLMFKYAGEDLLKKVLPIYDDLGRSLQHTEETEDYKSLIDGIKLIYNNFTKQLEEAGIQKIDPKGEQFDFNFHEALLQQPSTEVPEETVLQVVEIGYLYKDKVIKHAKVIVSTEAN
jgi:molecular chaperone GrpE